MRSRPGLAGALGVSPEHADLVHGAAGAVAHKTPCVTSDAAVAPGCASDPAPGLLQPLPKTVDRRAG